MYAVDERDVVIEMHAVPQMNEGAPCPVVFAEEHALVLSYWMQDDEPFQPTKAPLAVVRFHLPYYHHLGPLNEDRGLEGCRAYRVQHSSLIRQMERMNALHPHHQLEPLEKLTHYIFVFHDSMFECLAKALRSSVEQAGWDQQDTVMLKALRKKWNLA